jgi:hypothetical protein
MSQFIIRKKNNNNNDKEKHIIVLKNINITNLDKEYVMKEIKENTTKKFIKNSTNVSSISTEEIINNLEKEKNKQPILEIKDIPLEKTNSFLSPKKLKKKDIEKDEKINDLRSVTTKLEHLGISNEQKTSIYQPLIKNDTINVKLYTSLPLKDDKKTIPTKTNICCWWCKYPIPSDVNPIGCPVKFFKKDISKNINEDYFETDGIFCSFNCTLAYINDLSVYDIRYRESTGLLYILYKKIFNEFPPQMCIKPALNWRLLKNFGGIISIDEFRNNFQKIDNISLNYIKKDFVIKINSISYVEETTKDNLKY